MRVVDPHLPLPAMAWLEAQARRQYAALTLALDGRLTQEEIADALGVDLETLVGLVTAGIHDISAGRRRPSPVTRNAPRPQMPGAGRHAKSMINEEA